MIEYETPRAFKSGNKRAMEPAIGFSAPPLSQRSSSVAVAKIENASEDTVRAVLLALCRDSNVGTVAMRYFAKVEGVSSKRTKHDSNANIVDLTKSYAREIHADEGEQNKKRKATSRIRVCIQCDEAFDNNENRPNACLYHPGTLYMDDEADIWEEWEDWRDGYKYSKETRLNYPEGFTWSCCEADGDGPGCTLGFHSVVSNI
ncbi:hypothetical protein F4777DRAFT_530606 [Nemania sp. FL0916]|nr:hypothetical protein F4777DRAFT_530606 [Nemania sp. FL0916]